jgi:hypothetical protein
MKDRIRTLPEILDYLREAAEMNSYFEIGPDETTQLWKALPDWIETKKQLPPERVEVFGMHYVAGRGWRPCICKMLGTHEGKPVWEVNGASGLPIRGPAWWMHVPKSPVSGTGDT